MKNINRKHQTIRMEDIMKTAIIALTTLVLLVAPYLLSAVYAQNVSSQSGWFNAMAIATLAEKDAEQKAEKAALEADLKTADRTPVQNVQETVDEQGNSQED